MAAPTYSGKYAVIIIDIWKGSQYESRFRVYAYALPIFVKRTNYFLGRIIFRLFKTLAICLCTPRSSYRWMMNTFPSWLSLFHGKLFVTPFSNIFKFGEFILWNGGPHWCERLIVGCCQISAVLRVLKDVLLKPFWAFSHQIWFMVWRVFVKQNHVSMSPASLRSFIGQKVVPVCSLLTITLCLSVFAGLYDFKILKFDLVLPDSMHGLLAETCWSLC